MNCNKLINDLEMIQTFAELRTPTPAGEAENGCDALRAVMRGGFFGKAHRMARDVTEFHPRLMHDWTKIGTREERCNAQDASLNATAIWQSLLHDFTLSPACDPDGITVYDVFVARRSAEVGPAAEG